MKIKGAKPKSSLRKGSAKVRIESPTEIREHDESIDYPVDGTAHSSVRIGFGIRASKPGTYSSASMDVSVEVPCIPGEEVDAADIVSGKAQYGLDARLPGMHVAVLARCPYFEGTLKSFDATAARKLPGVRSVVPLGGIDAQASLDGNLAAAIAVVATDTWSAMRGREALRIEWSPGRWGDDSSTALEARAHETLSSAGTTSTATLPISSVVSRPQRTRLGGLLGLFGLSLLLS